MDPNIFVFVFAIKSQPKYIRIRIRTLKLYSSHTGVKELCISGGLYFYEGIHLYGGLHLSGRLKMYFGLTLSLEQNMFEGIHLYEGLHIFRGLNFSGVLHSKLM